MYQLSDPALEAILKEWHPEEYDPPNTNIREWIRSLESLCDTYGIPDLQRPQCAAGFIKDELSAELLKVLIDARTKFGPVYWDRFKCFMVAFDEAFREQWEKLPFYQRHPRLTGAALGIAGGILLTPVTTSVMSYMGLGAGGAAVASVPATTSFQSIVYGRMTGGIFSLLQSAGVAAATQPVTAAAVLPSMGVLFSGATGAAATGTGVFVATNDQPGPGIRSELFQKAAKSGIPGEDLEDDLGDDEKGNLPPYRATIPEEYILTPQATLAIVKSWDVWTYNPPGTNCTSWLRKIHTCCERYGIPLTQRAACAVYHMRTDCKEAACNAECYDMTWDEFATWLRQYDHEDRKSTNRRIVELSASKSEK